MHLPPLQGDVPKTQPSDGDSQVVSYHSVAVSIADAEGVARPVSEVAAIVGEALPAIGVAETEGEESSS
jgi:hypothetical protein